MSAQAAAAAAQQVGQIYSGFATWQQSRAKASALRANAKAARGDASMEAQMRADDGERAAGQAAVVGAATGGGFDGSFGTALDQLERNAQFNVRSAIWSGETEAKNLEYEAKIAKMEGNMALVGAFIGAGASIAGDRARVAEQRKQNVARKNLYRKGMG